MLHIQASRTGRGKALALAAAMLLCGAASAVSAQPIGDHICKISDGSSIVLTTTLGPLTLDTANNGNVRVSCGEVGPRPRSCAGDCNTDGEVHIDELITGVEAGLDRTIVNACSNVDVNGDGNVQIDELVGSVGASINGCPSAGEGAECTCDIIDYKPLNLSGIGFVCNYAAPGCDPGFVSCSGGEHISVDVYGERIIGECTSNEQCDDMCEQFCAARGMKPTPSGFGCVGYCRGGERDGLACDCDGFNPTSCSPGPVIGGCPGGECPGQNRETPGSCNCQCQKTDLGPLTEPGGMTCNLGTHLVVEQTIGEPCDGNDILVDVGTVCIPMTTDTAESTVHNVNGQLVCKSSGALCGSDPGCNPGDQCECDPGDTCDFNVFHKVATGAPVTCDQLRDTGVTGLHNEGVVNFFGSDLGDILTQVSTNCEEAPKCPVEPGAYTIRQTSGGSLQVDGLPAFPFPRGGRIVADIASGVQPDCVHDVVVGDTPVQCVGGANDSGFCTTDDECPPDNGHCDLTATPAVCIGGRNDGRTCTGDTDCPPDIGHCGPGFSAPVFCVPGLNFTVKVEQTGCGIGKLDSNGGSDFTVNELGDTSAPTSCNMPASPCSPAGGPGDSNVRVDVTVGDDEADTCASGTGNMLVSIPVFTTTWINFAGCPDPDGEFNGSDQLVVAFPQILDFTTDTNSADWQDLEADGCCLDGSGPGTVITPCNPGGVGGLSSTGVCADFTAKTITTVASGPIGSAGPPLFDLTFTNRLPNTIEGPSALTGATCANPPLINLDGGTVMRCINPDAG